MTAARGRLASAAVSILAVNEALCGRRACRGHTRAMSADWQRRIEVAGASDAPMICDLLRRCRLDSVGVLAPGSSWFIVRTRSQVVGTAGLESGCGVALLRSIAVDDQHRHGGLGQQLVARAVDAARADGATTVYLFSTGAGAYFSRLGLSWLARSGPRRWGSRASGVFRSPWGSSVPAQAAVRTCES